MSSVNGDNSSGGWLGYLWGSSNNSDTEEVVDDTTQVDQTERKDDDVDPQEDAEVEHYCTDNCPAHLQQQQQEYASFWSRLTGGYCGVVGTNITDTYTVEDDNGQQYQGGGWESHSAEMLSESPTRMGGTPYQEYVQGDGLDDNNG